MQGRLGRRASFDSIRANALRAPWAPRYTPRRSTLSRPPARSFVPNGLGTFDADLRRCHAGRLGRYDHVRLRQRDGLAGCLLFVVRGQLLRSATIQLAACTQIRPVRRVQPRGSHARYLRRNFFRHLDAVSDRRERHRPCEAQRIRPSDGCARRVRTRGAVVHRHHFRCRHPARIATRCHPRFKSRPLHCGDSRQVAYHGAGRDPRGHPFLRGANPAGDRSQTGS